MDEAVQPLELVDFSGGMTDNWFDSAPNRYEKAENFFITIDRKLQERWGTVPFDPLNYILPGLPRRIDGLFTYINESRIAVNQGRDIFVIPETYQGWGSGNYGWSRVTGPSGNEAIGAGSSYAQTIMSEWQHQMYFTNDSQPIPSRVYRDGTNTYQARTAGLPRAFINPNYNSVTLLQTCITNANVLRTAMINHISDAAAVSVNWTLTSPPNQHAFLDKWSLSYFQSESFNGGDPETPGPVPAPIPAPAATDLASLLTLVGALNNAYTHHAVTTVAAGFYHFVYTRPAPGASWGSGGTLLKPGPQAPLSAPVTPTTLNQAAAMLDDLYQKFYWHMFGVFLHGGAFNTISIMNRYDYTNTIQKIGTTGYNVSTGLFPQQAPIVSANNQDFFDYVNGLAAMYNAHLQGGGNTQLFTGPTNGGSWAGYGSNDALGHIQPDTENICTLPLATTLDQAYLVTYWIRNLYENYHVIDSNNLTSVQFKFSGSASSTSLTSVQNPGSSNITLPTNTYIFTQLGTPIFTGSTGFQNVAVVTASGSGTATIDRTLIGNASAQVAFYTTGQRRYHMYYSAPNTPAAFSNYIPSSAVFLTTASTSLGTDLTSWNTLAQEFMYALFNHMTDAKVHQQANPPANDATFTDASTPGVSQWFIPTISSIAYAFTYYYQWTVDQNGVQYVNESNPTFTSSVETVEPLAINTYATVPQAATTFLTQNVNLLINVQRSIGVSSIPVIKNDKSTNYDTGNIQVRIYRTTNGGNTFYLDQTVSNGTTTFSDTQNSTKPPPGQTLLSDNEPLYTTGGVVGNDQPPQCKCMHILAGTAYYGNLIVAGQYLPNTILQALPGSPDSAPATFTDTLEDELIAISSARSNVISFCRNSIYRMIGSFNSLGQGTLTHERISDSIGLLSARSVVRTEIGVFFAGSDGFYYTDGFQIIKVSIDLNKTYAQMVQTQAQRDRIVGAYDKTTRRVWWSMQSNPTASDCDVNFIFYLDYGIKPSGVFTTVKNRGDLVPATTNGSSSPSVGNPLHYDYWNPSAIVFQQGIFIKGDSRGILVKSDPYSTTDPKVDLTATAYTFSGLIPTQQWNTVPIPYNYISTAISQGSHWRRKYATRVNFLGKNVGNAQIQIVGIADNGRTTGELAPINYVQNSLWGDATITWGATASPNFNWYYGGDADFWRRFPANNLRSNLRQIQLTNAFMGIYRSEDFPQGTSASVTQSTLTVTLNSPAYPPAFYGTINWPLDVVDYYIAFADDGYVNTWQIASVSANTLTILDPNSLIPSDKSNLGFVIRGYKKNMSLEISSLVIRYTMGGDKTQAWKSAADSGENT